MSFGEILIHCGLFFQVRIFDRLFRIHVLREERIFTSFFVGAFSSELRSSPLLVSRVSRGCSIIVWTGLLRGVLGSTTLCQNTIFGLKTYFVDFSSQNLFFPFEKAWKDLLG